MFSFYSGSSKSGHLDEFKCFKKSFREVLLNENVNHRQPEKITYIPYRRKYYGTFD